MVVLSCCMPCRFQQHITRDSASQVAAPARQPLPPAATPCSVHHRAASAGSVTWVARRFAQARLPVTRAHELDAAMAGELGRGSGALWLLWYLSTALAKPRGTACSREPST